MLFIFSQQMQTILPTNMQQKYVSLIFYRKYFNAELLACDEIFEQLDRIKYLTLSKFD